MSSRRLRYGAAGLMLVAAGLFAIGVAVERSSEVHRDADVAADPVHVEVEGAEPGHHESHGSTDEHDEHTVLGIDTESWATVSAAVALSAALAAALMLTSLRWVLLTAVAFALTLAALDIAELVHQIDNSKSGLALLAAAVAAAHLASSGATSAAMTRRR